MTGYLRFMMANTLYMSKCTGIGVANGSGGPSGMLGPARAGHVPDTARWWRAGPSLAWLGPAAQAGIAKQWQ